MACRSTTIRPRRGDGVQIREGMTVSTRLSPWPLLRREPRHFDCSRR
jgi:hypothetical protein